ncbi:alpha/beta fold hydrolase [Kitasatospora sp. NPDC001527]|uniref:alpha/beta fold hydrolase n=1 Tax=Kitasatospora sp. NPDC001527 TaxID=3154519 RepID=UPI003324227F
MTTWTTNRTGRRSRLSALGRRTVALLAVLALAQTAGTANAVAAPAGATAPGVPARYSQQRLDWQPCAEEAALECAAMTVPRDWHHPGRGPDLTVAVSRHRASDPGRRIGTLLTAAGGPGGTGLRRPAGFVRDAPALGAAYDVVGFDQRGVGHSTRAVCQTPEDFRAFFAGDFRDDTPADRARVITASRGFAADCERRSDGLLPYLTTEQAVRDLDLLRALLGERRVSYYGPSYGTVIGAYYATLFPQRVERMVLDSVIGFDGTWERFEQRLPMSFQRRFEEDFLPWLAARDAVYHYGTTAAEVKARWEARRAAPHEHPLVDGTLTIGPNQLDNGTIRTSTARTRASPNWPPRWPRSTTGRAPNRPPAPPPGGSSASTSTRSSSPSTSRSPAPTPRGPATCPSGWTGAPGTPPAGRWPGPVRSPSPRSAPPGRRPRRPRCGSRVRACRPR